MSLYHCVLIVNSRTNSSSHPYSISPYTSSFSPHAFCDKFCHVHLAYKSYSGFKIHRFLPIRFIMLPSLHRASSFDPCAVVKSFTLSNNVCLASRFSPILFNYVSFDKLSLLVNYLYYKKIQIK